MTLHSQRERFQTAQHKKTVERALNGADRVLQEPHPIAELFVVPDDRDAADHIGVSIQIFRRRMNRDVETELERPLDPRRRKRVVRYRKDLLLARNFRDRFQIDDFQKRIARRLDPNHARVFLDCFLEARCIRKVDIGEFETGGLFSNLVEQAECAAVKIVAHDNV